MCSRHAWEQRDVRIGEKSSRVLKYDLICIYDASPHIYSIVSHAIILPNILIKSINIAAGAHREIYATLFLAAL